MHGTGSSGTIDNTTVNTTSVRRLHGLNKTGFNVATASDILRGSYRYGNQDQLDDMCLDGTNSCGNGAIVFTKNHALVMYRYYIHAATINVQTYNNYTTSSSYLNPSRPNFGGRLRLLSVQRQSCTFRATHNEVIACTTALKTLLNT